MSRPYNQRIIYRLTRATLMFAIRASKLGRTPSKATLDFIKRSTVERDEILKQEFLTEVKRVIPLN